MKLVALFILLIALCGCHTQHDYIAGMLPSSICNQPEHRTIETVKRHYFVPKAYESIRDIPAFSGPNTLHCQALGVNGWTHIASLFTGHLPGRRVVITNDSFSVGITGIIHEYIHQLDDMDRDGEGEFFDHDELPTVIFLLRRDLAWKHLLEYAEDGADWWVTDLFGIGENSEIIAYLATRMTTKGGPEYLWRFFRKTLRH